MNLLLRSTHFTATDQPPGHEVPLNASHPPKPKSTLEGLIFEDQYSNYSTSDGLIGDRFGGDDAAIGSSNGGKLPCDWKDASDISSFRTLDRSFIFPGEQIHVLACLSSDKCETEILTPFKVAAVMNKNGMRQTSKEEVRHIGCESNSELVETCLSSHVIDYNGETVMSKTPYLDDYHEKVTHCWKSSWDCRNLFTFQSKLKVMKMMMKVHFGKSTRGMEKRVEELRKALGEAQHQVEQHPYDQLLVQKEHCLAKEFRKVKGYQLLLYQQRTKLRWLNEGDANSKFFHSFLKGCRGKNNIRLVKGADGLLYTDHQAIKNEFINYFKTILADSSPCRPIDPNVILRGSMVEDSQCRPLISEATDIEIWHALSRIGSDKSPGPDGFSASFFRKNWSLIGKEFCAGIRHCLKFNALPRGMNAAIIALIPKSKIASEPCDYRPIACCNVAYKVISNLLAERLKIVLPGIIDKAQGAFVQGRSIVGNVCLAQQIVSGYGMKAINERMAWKIDLRKAYDTVNWQFIHDMLVLLKFPQKFISWIDMCVQTTSFSIQISRESVGFFEGKRGLRQGDPISPLLFTIAMEYLSRILKGLNKSQGYYHHPKCHRVDLKHLIFTDDLFLFSSGRCSSIVALKEGLDSFLQCSGLAINTGKSQLFLAGFCETKKSWVENLVMTNISAFPVRYLGFPLTYKNISAHDCTAIVQRLTGRINYWSNRFLSRAGRRLLIISVLQAIVFYWARICLLPKKALKAINSICANFLWNGKSTGRGCHLLDRNNNVCLDKKEGGLGIKNLDIMNDGMAMNQIWDLNKDNLNIWSEWIKAYWTKGTLWWENDRLTNSSWVLRRLAYCKKLSEKCTAVVDGRLVWKGEGEGFSVKDTYRTLKTRRCEVDWYKIAWNCFNTPRASLNAVLAARDLTKSRMRIMTINVDPMCVLCKEEEESRDKGPSVLSM